MIVFGFSFLLASFVLFLVKEKESKVIKFNTCGMVLTVLLIWFPTLNKNLKGHNDNSYYYYYRYCLR